MLITILIIEILLTFTGSIINKLVAGIAVAIVPSGSVNTQLRTASVVDITLVFPTFVTRFVFCLLTIWMSVTDLCKRNTSATTTIKLLFGITLGLRYVTFKITNIIIIQGSKKEFTIYHNFPHHYRQDIHDVQNNVNCREYKNDRYTETDQIYRLRSGSYWEIHQNHRGNLWYRRITTLDVYMSNDHHIHTPLLSRMIYLMVVSDNPN